MEQEITKLKERVELLENVISDLSYSDRFIFQKHLQLLDGRSITFSTVNGSKIGTGITQKIAFHGSTPVAQRTGTAQVAVDTAGAFTGAGAFGYTEAQANAIIALVNELRAALVAKGLIKGSA